jgi:hypothetical protein
MSKSAAFVTPSVRRRYALPPARGQLRHVVHAIRFHRAGSHAYGCVEKLFCCPAARRSPAHAPLTTEGTRLLLSAFAAVRQRLAEGSAAKRVTPRRAR